MTTSFEEAKAQLQKTGADGVSVYDHLSDVILRVLREGAQPDALTNIESVSQRVKAERMHHERLEEGSIVVPGAQVKEAIIAQCNKTLAMFGVAKAAGDETEAEAPGPSVCADVIAEAALLQWAGVGFGEEETMLLALALTKLEAKCAGAISIRLFGKINGLNAEYVIAEVKMPEGDAAAVGTEADKAETVGQGSNEFAYWVTTDITSAEWTRLPDVLPEQIRLSRSKRRLLTGDLSANVLGTPWFKWSEASLLRVIVGRIAASTVLAPAGYYEDKGEDGGIVVAEGFEGVGGEWIHGRGGLLKQGRVKPFVKPEAEEGDEAAEKVVEEDVEEALPALRALSEDVTELGSAWSFRTSPGPHPVQSAHSIIWPGAVSVGKGKSFVTIYVGNGQRQLLRPYQPQLPRAFQVEFKDDEDEPKLKEQEDPIPPPVDPAAAADPPAEE